MWCFKFIHVVQVLANLLLSSIWNISQIEVCVQIERFEGSRCTSHCSTPSCVQLNLTVSAMSTSRHFMECIQLHFVWSLNHNWTWTQIISEKEGAKSCIWDMFYEINFRNRSLLLILRLPPYHSGGLAPKSPAKTLPKILTQHILQSSSTEGIWPEWGVTFLGLDVGNSIFTIWLTNSKPKATWTQHGPLWQKVTWSLPVHFHSALRTTASHHYLEF